MSTVCKNQRWKIIQKQMAGGIDVKNVNFQNKASCIYGVGMKTV